MIMVVTFSGIRGVNQNYLNIDFRVQLIKASNKINTEKSISLPLLFFSN